MGWADDAACKGRTDDMFPRFGAPTGWLARARKMCHRCPVQHECLSHVLELERRHGPQEGVWAGLTPDERERLRSLGVERQAVRVARIGTEVRISDRHVQRLAVAV